MTKKKYYYPHTYKHSWKEPETLRLDFHTFVKKYADIYNKIPIVDIIVDKGNNTLWKWLGFVIDDFKNKLVIATCSHVINKHNQRSHIINKDIYTFGYKTWNYIFGIDKIYNSLDAFKDLAYIVCHKPSWYSCEGSKFSDGMRKCLVWWFYQENTMPLDKKEWSFYTWYKLDNLLKVINSFEDGHTTEILDFADILETIKLNKQTYIQCDMISKKGMSGGPIISDHGVEWMLIGWSFDAHNASTIMMPAKDILSIYKNAIRPKL